MEEMSESLSSFGNDCLMKNARSSPGHFRRSPIFQARCRRSNVESFPFVKVGDRGASWEYCHKSTFLYKVSISSSGGWKVVALNEVIHGGFMYLNEVKCNV